MNPTYKCLFTFFLLLLASCGGGHDHSESSSDAEHEAHEAAEHKHDSGDIVLESETADRFGVKCSDVSSEAFAGALMVTGELSGTAGDEVVISAPTTGVLSWTVDMTPGLDIRAGQQLARIQAKNATGDDPNRVAKAAVASAKRELDRLRPLLDAGIATKAEYNAALSAYESAVASVSVASNSGVVKSPRGGVVTEVIASTGAFVETGTVLARVVQNRNLVLRADIPEADASILSHVSDVKIRLMGSDEWISLANAGMRKLNSSDMPAKAGYYPAYYSFRNDGRFASGSYVEVELETGDSRECMVLPESALVEQQGGYYTYVKTGDHSYQKRSVTIGSRNGNRVEIKSGLKAGERVVTEGAQIVRMAESSGAVPEGHSHNH